MRIIEGMILQEVAGDYVAVPTGAALEVLTGVVQLNRTGKDIWEGIDAGKSVDEIAQYLVDNYDDVEFEDARMYTQGLVNKLVAEGLVIL